MVLLVSYSVGSDFESRPGDRLSWPVFFLGFLRLSRGMLG